MKTTEERINKCIMEQIRAISEKLRVVEEHMAWLITAEQRFTVGQRVEWSRKAIASGWPTRKKARRGIVKAIDGFSIVVKLDGIKKQTSFHHGFFNPVTGSKLF